MNTGCRSPPLASGEWRPWRIPLCRGRLFTAAIRIFTCYLSGIEKKEVVCNKRQQRRLRSVVGMGGKAPSLRIGVIVQGHLFASLCEPDEGLF